MRLSPEFWIMACDRSVVELAELTVVFDVLDDVDAQAITRELEEPMTVSKVSDTYDIPPSTTYRKLNLLADAALPFEGTQIRADGHHAATYEVAFDEV